MNSLFARIFFWFWGSAVVLIALTVLATALFSSYPPPPPPDRLIRPLLEEFLKRSIHQRHASSPTESSSPTVLASSSDGMVFYAIGPEMEIEALPPGIRESVAKARGSPGWSQRIVGSVSHELFREPGPASFAAVGLLSAPRFLTFFEQTQQVRGLISIVTILLLGSGVICWLLSSSLSKPLESLRAYVTGFPHFHDSSPNPMQALEGSDEIGMLAREFTHLQHRLEKLQETRNRFFAEVSHELRTPLTRIQLAAAMLADAPLEDQPGLRERIAMECGALDRLVEELLSLARHDAGMAGQQPLVSLGKIVSKVIDDATVEALSKNVRMVVSGNTDLQIRASPVLISRALENILRNAIRHAPSASEITIALESMITPDQKAWARITVRDHGPGIADSMLNKVKQPFFSQVPQEGEKPGVGLGLAVVDRIAATLGGNLTLANAHDGGLLVSLILPESTR